MIKTLAEECSEFIKDSFPLPLLKNLPLEKDGFIKVKIRHKKNKKFRKSEALNAFNKALETYYKELTFKALYAYPEETLKQENNCEPFYIFPVNGYKYIYNTAVTCANDTYNKLFSTLHDSRLNAIFDDIIKDSYHNENLKNGIANGAEIIIFNISHYYAIRKSLIETSYEDFINSNY